MKIAVLGTGTVGRTIADRLDGLGHDVSVGTRDPEATLARSEGDGPTVADWLADHPTVRLAAHDDAATGADVVVNATNGGGALAALQQAGAANLAGKVVVDIANPWTSRTGSLQPCPWSTPTPSESSSSAPFPRRESSRRSTR